MALSIAQQFMIIWICGFVFLILTALKLDGSLQVIWFVVFVPVFILNAIHVLFFVFQTIQHARHTVGMRDTATIFRKVLDGLSLFCLITFEILLCVRLDVDKLGLYYVFLPLWLLLIDYGLSFFLFQLHVVRNNVRPG